MGYSNYSTYSEYVEFIDGIKAKAVAEGLDPDGRFVSIFRNPLMEKYGRMKANQEQSEVKENQPNKADQTNIVSRQGETGGQGTTSLSGDRRGSSIDREALALGYALAGALLGGGDSKLGE